MPVPEVGQPAPDFEAQADNGEMVKLSDFRGKRVVLYFYPKADTPGCTQQSCAYRDNYNEFASKNALILGASPDTVEEQAAFKMKYNLPFTLLADPDRQIAEAYGVWQTYRRMRDDQEVEVTGIRRSSFIIDENGIISGVFIGVDPANNTQEMLANL
ncbi:MAG TPA: peroxiredoxin [Spirillospora sp.]|nr:peroxiredoxin [Spirillospora sp.]